MSTAKLNHQSNFSKTVQPSVIKYRGILAADVPSSVFSPVYVLQVNYPSHDISFYTKMDKRISHSLYPPVAVFTVRPKQNAITNNTAL